MVAVSYQVCVPAPRKAACCCVSYFTEARPTTRMDLILHYCSLRGSETEEAHLVKLLDPVASGICLSSSVIWKALLRDLIGSKRGTQTVSCHQSIAKQNRKAHPVFTCARLCASKYECKDCRWLAGGANCR